MRKIWKTGMVLLAGLVIAVGPALAQEMSTAQLRQELELLQKRMAELEARLAATSPGGTAENQKQDAEGSGTLGLPERVRKLEEQMGETPLLGKWTDRITLSGLIEVEASYEDTHFDQPGIDDEDSSDLSLATVELGVDVDVVKHVKGHVLFLYEEEDDADIEVDEAFITLSGEDVVPLYLDAGRLYVPFGYFESHFISDPLTLEIGETQETAAKLGFADEMFDVSLAVFNGDIDEEGDDDHISSWTAGAIFTMPEEWLPNVGLKLGTSYISNIADSDGISDALDEVYGVDTIDDDVDGAHAFLSLSFMERVFLKAEYVAALDDIEPKGTTEEFEPKAWNVELAFVPVEDCEVGLRYGGTDETLNLLPEDLFGGVVTYQLFENTTLALEYMHSEFENDDETDAVTTQLAIEF